MANVGSTVPHFYTRDELAKIHQDVLDNKPEAKKLIVVDNKVYDITEFINDHPGGPKVISTQEGRDASDVFREMHPPSAYELLANCYVGDCEPRKLNTQDEKKVNSAKFAEEVRAYRDQVEKQGLFNASPLFYLYKTTSTVMICVLGLTILKMWGKSSVWGVLLSSFIVGVFWQQCGWLAHDFAHHQVFKDVFWSDFFVVMYGNLLQGFSLSWWKNKHNTHHAATNVSGEDPDIDTAPVLIWDEFAAANYYGSLKGNDSKFDKFMAEHVVPYQTRYYFFILSFARLSWAIQSIMYSFKNESVNKSKITTYAERIFLVIHWVFFATCATLWTDSWKDVALFFIVSQVTTGYLLAFVFAMNHNGMPVVTSEEANEMEFYELQVITGRDVSLSAFGDWVFGGLNYQIEHHIFPEMPRHNLPLVKPTIKKLCQKYNIHHHDTDMITGTLEVLKTLDVVQNVSKNFIKKMF